MNEFQKKIGATLGVAVPGTIVEAAESYKLVEHFITEDDSCVIGSFVKKGSAEGKVVAATGDGEVIGIIVKNGYLTGEKEGIKIPAGENVAVLLFGVVAVENTATAAATFNDKVLMKKADGILIFAKASATATAEQKETGWKVKQGADKKGIVFLTK